MEPKDQDRTTTWMPEPFRKWMVHCPRRSGAETPLPHLAFPGSKALQLKPAPPVFLHISPPTPNPWKFDLTPDGRNILKVLPPVSFPSRSRNKDFSFLKSQCHSIVFCVSWAASHFLVTVYRLPYEEGTLSLIYP